MIENKKKIKTSYIEFQETQTPLIESIPKFVLLHIFSYLNTPSQLTKVACVCKKWRILANNKQLWSLILKKRGFIEISDNLFNSKDLCLQAIRDEKISKNHAFIPFEKLSDSMQAPITALALYKDLIYVATKGGGLQIVSCATGDILETKSIVIKEINYHQITKLALFKNHVTAIIKWWQNSDHHTGAVILDRNTLKVLHLQEFSQNGRILEIQENIIYFKYGGEIYGIELDKQVYKSILNTKRVKKSLVHHPYAYIQGRNNNIDVFHLPEGELLNSLEAQGFLIQAEENIVFTYTKERTLIIHKYDIKNKSLETLDLETIIQHSNQSHILNACINGNFLMLKLDCEIYFQRYDQIIQNPLQRKKTQRELLLFIDKNTFKLVRLLNLPSCQTDLLISDKGYLVSINNEYSNQLCITDLTQAKPKKKKDKKCIIC